MSRTSPSAARIGASLRGGGKPAAQAIREIGIALGRSGGNLTDACTRLEVSPRIMRRWVKEYPELEAEVRRVREAKGVPHYFGDPARSKIDPKPRRAPRAKRAAAAAQ